MFWGVIDTNSNVMSDAENVKKSDTSVHSSTTQERNLELSFIEEESLKSIFPELGTKLDSSVQVNLANYVARESTKFKRLGHPPIETEDIRNIKYISSTRPKNCNGLRRSTDTLQQPQFFMFTGVNSPSVNFSSQNVFEVDQP